MSYIFVFQVPPDALHPPQASKTENSTETVKHSSHSEIETPDQSFQTRTEIVGGVVVTKKLTSDGHSVRVRISQFIRELILLQQKIKKCSYCVSSCWVKMVK